MVGHKGHKIQEIVWSSGLTWWWRWEILYTWEMMSQII